MRSMAFTISLHNTAFESITSISTQITSHKANATCTGTWIMVKKTLTNAPIQWKKKTKRTRFWDHLQMNYWAQQMGLGSFFCIWLYLHYLLYSNIHQSKKSVQLMKSYSFLTQTRGFGNYILVTARSHFIGP